MIRALRRVALEATIAVEREHARRALARVHSPGRRSAGDRWRDARRHLRRAKRAGEALARLAACLAALVACACGGVAEPGEETVWLLERATIDPNVNPVARAEIPPCAVSVDAVGVENDFYVDTVSLSVESGDGATLATKRGDELLYAPGLPVPPGARFAAVSVMGSPTIVTAWATVETGCRE